MSRSFELKDLFNLFINTPCSQQVHEVTILI